LAAEALDGFAVVWDTKYPMIAKSWRNRWNEGIPFFTFSPEIRKAVYTTNAIESVNFTIQKIIRHRQSFLNEEAAIKIIFMDLKNISKKWTMPIRDWGLYIPEKKIHQSSKIDPCVHENRARSPKVRFTSETWHCVKRVT
jgi:transposase-like protein